MTSYLESWFGWIFTFFFAELHGMLPHQDFESQGWRKQYEIIIATGGTAECKYSPKNGLDTDKRSKAQQIQQKETDVIARTQFGSVFCFFIAVIGGIYTALFKQPLEESENEENMHLSF